MELCVLREAIAHASPEAETALALQGLGSYPILQSGSPELVGAWIPAVASGDAVAAFALTEPGAGSDAAALTLRAEPDGDGFRLTGAKKWISNAPNADVYVVFARTTEGAGARGVTAFVVPGDSAGLSGESLDLVAPHAIGALTFDGVFVPEASIREGPRLPGRDANARPLPPERRRVRGRDGPGCARCFGGARGLAAVVR
jgi:alkylation response protein AidB-like acyl-CoA dehydrogenase